MTGVQLPFKTVVSLKYFMEYWDFFSKSGTRAAVAMRDDFEEIQSENKWLMEPLGGGELDRSRKEVLNFLFSIIFPQAYSETQISGAIEPFIMKAFYGTESFMKVINKVYSKMHSSMNECSMQEKIHMTIIRAYSNILSEFYGIDAVYEQPLMYVVENDEGREQVYDIHFDPQFVKILASSLPELSERDLEYLRNNISDIEFLMKKLPPENFTFEGFTIVSAHDVTSSEMLSRMRRDLIANDALNSNEIFQRLQNNLRMFLGAKNIVLILKALEGDNVITINFGCVDDHRPMGHCNDDCAISRSHRIPVSTFRGTLMEEAVLSGRTIVVSDMTKYKPRNEIEKEAFDENFKSCVIAPLKDSDGTSGILMLLSENRNDFTSATEIMLQEIIPLFTLAVKRAMDDFEIRIQAIIQEQFTAIHPSVQWRFRKAALNFIDRRNSGKEPVIEKIIFDSVYPLYGQSDIRGSSTHRNVAIQQDLEKHLRLILEIISRAKDSRNLPVFDEMIFRVERHLALIDGDLSSGDEIEILNYIRRDFEPYLESFSEQGSEVKKLVDKYNAVKDQEYGTIYEERKRFDTSVMMINRAISIFIDREQIAAQEMFPHYFESQSTDGVDFSIYIGQSMSENRHFDLIYLKNLRLWQLIVLCKIARLTNRLKNTLPLPLDTTHLVVVQHLPITVGFHDDEKALHVEGAYNVRYEIMKKRIDKAVIKGTAERLTAVGAIAIVYSQQEEAREYLEYIEYLQDRNYIEEGYEDVVLADMQGIHGLRAFRININLEFTESEGIVMNEILSAAD